MNETHVLVVGVPALLTVVLILVRALTRSVIQVPSGSTSTKLNKKEDLFDWALHFSFGSTLLAILTVLGLAFVDRPHPAVGIFSGAFAGVMAYAVLRPPVRPDVKNPEFDGPLIAKSTGLHMGLGILIASFLIYDAGN